MVTCSDTSEDRFSRDVAQFKSLNLSTYYLCKVGSLIRILSLIRITIIIRTVSIFDFLCLLYKANNRIEILISTRTFEPPHDKTNKMACAPSENSNQPGHPPSLIRVFAVRSMGS